MNEQNNHAALTIAQQYPPAQYNLLVPMQTVTEIADIQKPVMNSVSISTNLNDGEIYEMEKAKDEWRDSKGYVHKATPAKYALTKKGLTKLMRAAGIKILSSRPVVPSTCQKCAEVNRSIGKPIRCGGCPNKDVKHEVRISVPQLTGENVTIVAHKEIAVEDVTAGMTEKQRAEFMKFRSEMCESKALNRALRTAMQIKSSYLIEEFKKPFVVAYLVPNLDNPAVREEAVKSMFGAANDLYGSRPKTSHTVYVDDDDEGYAQPEPDFEVVPEQPQQEQQPERPAQRPRQQQPARWYTQNFPYSNRLIKETVRMSVITFKPNDHTKITTDFERYEFACPCGCTAQMIDPELVQKMQTIRTKLGKAIKVTSGYRCVKHNADPKVGGSRTSRHLYGIAADWRTKDRSVNPVALGIIAAAQGFGAVGIYWHDKAAIVHTDTRGCKATWLCVQPGVYPSTTYNKFVLPTIEQGCEGAANRAATVMLQRLLGIPHDGSFGPATTKALMTAQRKHGLVPDGICGPKSWTALSGADKYL
ncbi:D-Ala-D-Ala carboxypeptidase family metallohydrolase [Faecalibacterium sp. I3-3-89]|uniref:D-Ala-D-Ala carboxypeptidase family metallohydrolase n=1 Tax=Faecalibacterium sp. I3-3-89 TaxID=2929493 RepID=UPI002014C61D|nr:D-Ala-D-Ala carboxypeptidase family metallohydrolase [Faecalibacterium sp. I3-3-89]UQK42174.1 D-Ala-D-Ala carboxypeptidase family metallohydrolase [Faecalibacterium sp. I3-3-89]